jgi:uroporphyrinogen-III synthase
MAGRILVTRPQPAAERTVRRLAAMGLAGVALPLTETVTLPAGPAGLPQAVDAVAATSENALRHASDALLAPVLDRPCFAVGARTAACARARGFGTVVEGPGDAAALAGTVLERTGADDAVLFLCGRERLGIFETALRAAGRRVTVVETYDTRPVAYDPALLRERLGGERFEAVLLYSVRASARCAELLSQGWLTAGRLLCLSPRIAAPLASWTGVRVETAGRPDEAALLVLLTPAANGS